jgi:hypothetical protein
MQISKQNRDFGMSENEVTNGFRKNEVMGEWRKYEEFLNLWCSATYIIILILRMRWTGYVAEIRTEFLL